MLCSGDVDLHIRLVKLFTSSGMPKVVWLYKVLMSYYFTIVGNLRKAFDYCNMINQKGYFVRTLTWQQCALSVAEVNSLIFLCAVVILSLSAVLL